jgi:hypothetical protein
MLTTHFQLHAPRTSPNNHNRIETHIHIIDAHSGINNSICAPRHGESEEYQPSTHSACERYRMKKVIIIAASKCYVAKCNFNLPLYGRNSIWLAILSAHELEEKCLKDLN